MYLTSLSEMKPTNIPNGAMESFRTKETRITARKRET